MTNTKAAAEKCKLRIMADVDAALRSLYEETGVNPAGVEIHMTDVTPCGDAVRKFVVSEVRLEFVL